MVEFSPEFAFLLGARCRPVHRSEEAGCSDHADRSEVASAGGLGEARLRMRPFLGGHQRLTKVRKRSVGCLPLQPLTNRRPVKHQSVHWGRVRRDVRRLDERGHLSIGPTEKDVITWHRPQQGLSIEPQIDGQLEDLGRHDDL